jgi:hypothetical protein
VLVALHTGSTLQNLFTSPVKKIKAPIKDIPSSLLQMIFAKSTTKQS